MLTLLPSLILGIFLLYLASATAYLIVLALASVFVKEPPPPGKETLHSFAILVPAHNEELLISRLLTSLLAVSYPSHLRRIFVIADNCTDGTAEESASYPVDVLVRNDPTERGKGFAIKHALEKIGTNSFDAFLIVDADSVVDPFVLKELNVSLNRGEQAIQCHNGLGNRHDSWFTELLYVSRVLNNVLYHHAKYKLGLSSHLMGNGMCFASGLLGEMGWTAFTAGEDWEYYTTLIEKGHKVAFALKAVVRHQESKSLEQATSQRLRWARGRFQIGRTAGLKLLFTGLRRRNMFMADASLPFIFPNYSLHANLAFLACFLSCLSPASVLKLPLICVSVALCLCLLALFVSGMLLAGSFFRILRALLHAPAFFCWKSAIDFLSVTGIYRGDKWVRTLRHVPAPAIDSGSALEGKEETAAVRP